MSTNFNRLVRILPGTIAQDLDTEKEWNDSELSKTVIFVLIITVLEILRFCKLLT